MLTLQPDKPELSPLEQLCLHFLLHVRGLRSGAQADQLIAGPIGPITIDSIAAAADALDAAMRAPRAPFLGVHAWQGITAEAQFMAAAFARNLGIAFPYGGGYVPFDFFLFTARHNYRIQVKFGSFDRDASWGINVRRRAGKGAYKKGDFDILAASGPDGVWYLIPFAALKGRKSLHIPRRPRKYDRKDGFPLKRYRERWELFR